MEDNKINLNHVTIVLNRPRHPENIGAAARSIKNMGLKSLIVVNPENYHMEKILKLATHAAADIVDQIAVENDLQTALSSFHYVVGTTARLGSQRHVISNPSVLAEKLIPISQENRIAIVFGPEDRGLSNEDIRLCHSLINIPTDEFTSINLAQAVMIICYEMFKASLNGSKKFTPRLASRHELDGMYDQLKDVLVRVNYIQPENPDYWMNKMRLFFSRLPLRASEVSIIRGVCRQILWYGRKNYQNGKDGKRSNKI